MTAKKMPYRKVLPPAHPPTHFTMEDARRAVREVMQEDRRRAGATPQDGNNVRRRADSSRSAA